MKQLTIYFTIECKRFLSYLKSMFIGAIVLVLIAGAVALCATTVFKNTGVNIKNDNGKKVKVAFVVEDDSKLMDIMGNVFQETESIDESCELIKVSKEEAEEMLQKSEVLASISIPEGFMKSVQNGKNYPVDIKFSRESDVVGQVFLQLSRAGADMLACAQAGIYAQHDFFCEHNAKAYDSEANYYLNKTYLKYVLEREKMFDENKLMATGETKLSDYYLSVGIIFVILMLGLAYPAYFHESSNQEVYKIMNVHGIGYYKRFVVKCIIPSLFQWIIAQIILFAYTKDSSLCLTNCVGLFLAMLCCNCIAMFLINLFKNIGDSVMFSFVILFALCFMSGFLLPDIFLPHIFNVLAKWMPIKILLTQMCNSVVGVISVKTWLFLTAWCVVLVLAGRISVYIRESFTWGQIKNKNSNIYKNCKINKSTPFTFLVIFCKRQCRKISFILFLMCIILGSLALKNAFVDNPIKINVALYTDTSDGLGKKTIDKLLEANDNEDNIISFKQYESEEELKRAVSANVCQSGYVIDKRLEQSLNDNHFRDVIKVYSNSDSIASITNELIFAAAFYNYAPNILNSYVRDSGWFTDLDKRAISDEVEQRYKERIGDGSTFSFEYYNEELVSKDTTKLLPGYLSLSVKGLLALLIFIAALAGAMKIYKDEKKYVFYSKYGIERHLCRVMDIAAVVLPIGAASYISIILTGYVFTNNTRVQLSIGKIATEMLWLMLYCIAVTIYTYVIYLVVKDERVYGFVAMALVLVSAISCPVIIDLETLIPVIKYIRVLLPLAWY